VAGRSGRRRRRRGRCAWRSVAVETAALALAGLVATTAALGELAAAVGGSAHLLTFSAGVLALAVAAGVALLAWLRARPTLLARHARAPAALALAMAVAALGYAAGPGFGRQTLALRTLVGGSAEAERTVIGHQVYAAYRRTDPAAYARLFERAAVYEATVHEAAEAFGVDPEVLMGVAAAESAFYPRDSRDGGRGLFQITAPPAAAVSRVRAQLGVKELDVLNQRHNAFLAAATLRIYLDEMSGDLFLGLLAYNIGPRNGGLRTAMERYGARDFATVQPYLQHLPRDYPIRVLSAALAYRLWRRDGRLPRYEEGDNAVRVQQVGIPGLG